MVLYGIYGDVLATYLVTGGAGFIGSHFIKTVLKAEPGAVVVNLDKLTYSGNIANLKDFSENARHVFIRGDICDKKLVGEIFSNYDISCVVNFAAESHVDRSIEDSAPFIRTNVSGVHTLLEATIDNWNDFNGKLFIQISTDEVYGSLPDDVFADEAFPLSPGNPYSASKAAADLLALSYFNTYKLPVIITRSCNNFGPHQYPEKLIPLMILNMMKNTKLPVYGDGMQIREWIFADDHCSVLQYVAKNGIAGEIYNIGSGYSILNIDLVKKIIDTYNEITSKAIDDSIIEFVTDRKGHDRRYGLNCSKLGGVLGKTSKADFVRDLKKTVRWYLENYKT